MTLILLRRLIKSTFFQVISISGFVFFLLGLFIFIFEGESNSDFRTIADGFWWAVITLSTTGYGDKVPVTLWGRILTTLTILFGVSMIGVLSGTIASIKVDKNARFRRGGMIFNRIKNHLIICGWKNGMKDILLDIIHQKQSFNPTNIIIVSNIDEHSVEDLQNTEELHGIKFVRGDYFSQKVLERANVTRAKKVLVLSDTFETGGLSEADSKTVMTVLTIKAIDKDIYTCAEILDRKYEEYLKKALCDEIIYPKETGRRLISAISAMDGMVNIYQEIIIGDKSRVSLTTVDMPDHLIGKPFQVARREFIESADKILFGLLENTGSPKQMKMEALREAQKTSDMGALIYNLQKVKELAINTPVIFPDEDYIIPSHSRLIFFEKAAKEKKNGIGRNH